MTQHMEEDRAAKLAREVERSVFKKDAIAACSTVDFRARSPREIGEQLVRDAQSLELTGASFEKDEQFYRNVAANVREAAGFLAQWQATIESLNASWRRERDLAMGAAYRDCAGIAHQVRDLVPAAHDPKPETWRSAADAILSAIMACGAANTSEQVQS